jgi:hypothetical protein
VDFRDVAQHAAADVLDDDAVAFVGVSAVAHLRGHAILLGGLSHDAGLVN